MASSARIDELRKKFDENPRRYFAPLANEYRKAGDLEQAIFICQEYLPQQPGHMSGHIVYGQALFELSRHEESRLVFETALSLDPENLIALRHLGDIARHMGDSKSARIWYQRVLEADPRNEEIAQIMMTLLATPDVSQPSVAPNTATPLSTPAVPAAAEPVDSSRPTDPIGIRAVETGFHVEKSNDGSDLAVGPPLTELPERQGTPVAPAPAMPEWNQPVPEDDLLDISDFSVGGVPLSDIGTAPSIDEPSAETEAPEAAAEEEEFTESSSAFVADSSLEYERSADAPDAAPVGYLGSVDDDSLEKDESSLEADLPFEADPFAIAAAPQLEEHVEDIALGLPDDGTPQTTFGGADESVLGLETFEHGESAPAAEPSTLEFESFEHGVSAPAAESSTLEFESFFNPPAETPSTVDSLVIEQSVEADAPFESATPAESAALDAWPVLDGGADGDDSIDVVEIVESVIETPSEQIVAFESSVSVWSEPEPEPEIVFETPIAPVAAVPEPEPAYSSPTPVSSTPAQSTEPQAFVTETMAELYLQQGHLEPALEIYQKLVEQRPDDLVLVDRMRVIEDTLNRRSARPQPSEPEAEPEPVASTSRGPTIRDFLTSLVAAPTPLSTPAVSSLDEAPGAFDDGGETWGETSMTSDAVTDTLDFPAIEEPASIDEDFGVAENIAPPEPVFDRYETPISSSSVTPRSTRPVTPRMNSAVTPLSSPSVTPLSNAAVTPPSSTAETPIVNPAVPATPAESRRTLTRGLTPAVARETVSGSIDALFSGADASSKDSTAADTLAQAFAPEGPDTTPLQGVPAHKASSELSLDHVFKTGQAPRAEGEGDGFSFDQFFSEDLGDTPTKGPHETPAAPKQGPDDIAQFNAWLNGLKKT